MKVFIVDVGVCNGCYGCQFACKDEHVGNDWAPIAKPQPDSGQFWMRVDEYVRGTVPHVRMHYVPNPCNHCGEAPCLESCPIEGAIYKRDDGLVDPGERQIGPFRPMGKVGRAVEIRAHSVPGMTTLGQIALERTKVRPLPHVLIGWAVRNAFGLGRRVHRCLPVVDPPGLDDNGKTMSRSTRPYRSPK